MSDVHAQSRRRPTIAKDWQLAVLKRLQAESGNPTEQQRSAAATETGLDEKWVRNWFTRQRSKLAARDRRRAPERRASQPPTFKVQLCHPPPSTTRPPPSPRLDAPTHPSPTLVSHTAAVPAYSRDPLSNRYPDFSHFFRPNLHARFASIELSAAMNSDSNLVRFLADPNTHSLAPNFLNPLHLCGLATHHSSSAYVIPCPVAFSVKLVDLINHHSLVPCPIFLPSESGNHTLTQVVAPSVVL